MNDQLLRVKLLAFMSAHRGREKAITRDDVLFAMQAHDPSLNDRSFRDLYSTLPICSTASKPYGLYLPTSQDEVESFLAEYACHARHDKVTARREVFHRERADLWPARAQQLTLDMQGGQDV